jgi:hypothetical protein
VVKFQKHEDVGGVHSFVVFGAAAVKVAIFNRGGKGIDGPLAALDSDHVQVTHQQKRLLCAVALQASNQAGPAGSGLHNLRRDTFGIEDTFDVLRSLDLIARRITGITFDQV